MILTEYGLHFAKEGDRWRCVEEPDLAMLRGGGAAALGSERSAHSVRR
jgi:hypothetical protein